MEHKVRSYGSNGVRANGAWGACMRVPQHSSSPLKLPGHEILCGYKTCWLLAIKAACIADRLPCAANAVVYVSVYKCLHPTEFNVLPKLTSIET
eukprot:scaffold162885_cov18-Tisochrysis_lutea.AAC.1